MKLKIVLSLLLVIIAGFFGFNSFKKQALKVKDNHGLITQISSRIFDFNTFNVIADTNINTDDLKIIDKASGNTIYKNGQSLKGIKNDYGYRKFELYFNNEKSFEIGHFIYNNWITNHYTLRLTKTNQDIEPKLIITGKHASYSRYYCKQFIYNQKGVLVKTKFINQEIKD